VHCGLSTKRLSCGHHDRAREIVVELGFVCIVSCLGFYQGLVDRIVCERQSVTGGRREREKTLG